MFEDFGIEEVSSEVDEIVQLLKNPENAMAIIDLMEEEYLKSIETEMSKEANVGVSSTVQINKSTKQEKGQNNTKKTNINDINNERNDEEETLDLSGKENILPHLNLDSKAGTSTGWDRIKKTQKTIIKKSRKRTLKVSSNVVNLIEINDHPSSMKNVFAETSKPFTNTSKTTKVPDICFIDDSSKKPTISGTFEKYDILSKIKSTNFCL